MNLNKYLKKSLARQFGILTITIIVAFSLLMTFLLFYQHQQQVEFEATNHKLDQKETLASQLDYAFNLAISEMRAYYAYKGDASYYQNVEEQRQIVKNKLEEMRALAETKEDVQFIKSTEVFYRDYFYSSIPKSKALYDAGYIDEVAKIAIEQNGSKTIRSYQNNLKKYTDQVSEQRVAIQQQQNKKILFGQLVFAVILLFLVGVMALLTRIMLGRIGRPLRELTVAASKIAVGQTVVFTNTTKRENELGLLSRAFEKMSKSIQEKEQDLRKLFEQSEGERLLTQNILDTINEGIQLVDTSGKIIQVNQKLCDMNCPKVFRIESEYEVWLSQLVDSVENGAEMTKFFNQILFTDTEEGLSIIYHQHNPAKRVMQVYGETLTRDGRKIGTVIVHRDISKEYEVDVMKSEFVSTVSHELRTPLASVLGFTELILNKELKPERQRKYLTTIYQEAKRLTALINDFLDVQRMESGKQMYDMKRVDIVPALSSLIETYQLNHPKHIFHLEVKTSNTIVYGDRDKLAQVFTNLISNAIKYSPDGGNVFVSVYEEGAGLKIAIKDEGLGIPADALDKLFTKFYRVDNSDRRKIGGTGLGLAIVKEIVKVHHGDITVSSLSEKGSIFTVSLPLAAGNDWDISAIQPEAAPAMAGKINVIIVEDDSSHANLIQAELEDSSFGVTVYPNAEAALAAVESNPPDAVVLDIMLGENRMNGWDFIKQMKAKEELKAIPIFVSTALEEKEKGIALGANQYLIKPYKPSKLSKVILQTLLQKDRLGQIHIPE